MTIRLLPKRFWARLNLAARLSCLVTLFGILVAFGSAYLSSRHVVQKAQTELAEDLRRQMDLQESIVLSAVVADEKSGRTSSTTGQMSPMPVFAQPQTGQHSTGTSSSSSRPLSSSRVGAEMKRSASTAPRSAMGSTTVC